MARDADVAIVLRRGPTRWARLLRWDLANDTIEPGQWLKGTVHPPSCGVSPNGELFVYFARQGPQTFTGVSRPPYFTALAFWQTGFPGGGGGFFTDDRHLVLNVTGAPSEGQLPPRLAVTDLWSYLAWNGNTLRPSPDTFGEACLRAPEVQQGWLRVGRQIVKPNPRDASILLQRDTSLGRTGPYRVVRSMNGAAAPILERDALDWADWTRDGTLIFGAEGRLFRQFVRAEDSKNLVAASLVADLTTHRFESIPAPPHAREWPPSLRTARGRAG